MSCLGIVIGDSSPVSSTGIHMLRGSWSSSGRDGVYLDIGSFDGCSCRSGRTRSRGGRSTPIIDETNDFTIDGSDDHIASSTFFLAHLLVAFVETLVAMTALMSAHARAALLLAVLILAVHSDLLETHWATEDQGQL